MQMLMQMQMQMLMQMQLQMQIQMQGQMVQTPMQTPMQSPMQVQLQIANAKSNADSHATANAFVVTRCCLFAPDLIRQRWLQAPTPSPNPKSPASSPKQPWQSSQFTTTTATTSTICSGLRCSTEPLMDGCVVVVVVTVIETNAVLFYLCIEDSTTKVPNYQQSTKANKALAL